jgi:hypothetical protein
MHQKAEKSYADWRDLRHSQRSHSLPARPKGRNEAGTNRFALKSGADCRAEFKALSFGACDGFSKGEASGTQVFLDIFFAFSRRAGNQNRGATQACSFGFYS